MRLCDSLSPSEGASRERRSLERRCDAVCVLAVTRLVHASTTAPSSPLSNRVVMRTSRLENDVQNGCTVGSSRYEPSSKPSVREDAVVERRAARPPGSACWRNDASTRGASLHELGEHGADRREHLGDLGGQHVRLEVVEQRRVGRVLPLEALDVPALEVEVPLERREELREVVGRARLDPDLVAERSRADHLRPQLGRDPALLLPVAARDADQARVVRVVVERLLERSEPFEQIADLGVDELLVRDASDGRHRLGTRGMAAGRHHDLLIPAEHADRLARDRRSRQGAP